MTTEKPIGTKFLNVDLDIRTQSGLDELINAFNSSAFVLSKTEHQASFELSEIYPASIDEAVLHFSVLIKAFPLHIRTLWEQCEVRQMNIGIQGGVEPYAAYFALSENAVLLLASIHAEIVFTVYGSGLS